MSLSFTIASFSFSPMCLSPTPIEEYDGVSCIIFTVGTEFPAATASACTFSLTARLWLSVLTSVAYVDNLKLLLPFTKVKFACGINFNFSSWDVHIVQIIFLVASTLTICNHENFSFHFCKVLSFGIALFLFIIFTSCFKKIFTVLITMFFIIQIIRIVLCNKHVFKTCRSSL